MIMNMNIYISKENEALLRQEVSMSGLINYLLEEHYAGRVPAPQPELPTYVVPTPDFKNSETTKVPSNSEPVTMNVLSLEDLQEKLGVESTPKAPAHICKENCYHWVYDINTARYTNSLTGETREAPDF